MLDARETLLHAVKDRLVVYAARVAVEQGKLSEGAEEFYRGLLNIMLGCGLKNMNHERDNFPAIDLGDDDARLCVQVTSTGSRAKVRHTLAEFFDNKLHKRFDRLIVLVIGDAQRFDEEPKNDHGFDFQTKRDIWDTVGLIRQVGKLEDDRLEAVAAYLQKRVSLPRREPLLDLPMGSAMRSGDFVGRETELRRIGEELAQNRVAFLSGLGGMGKTELALRYGQDYQVPGWRLVYFVRFKESFQRTVLDNIAPFIPGFSRDGMTEAQIFAGAMAVLRRCDPEDLLILDNADDAEESVDQLRRELSRLPMQTLVTTRAEDDGAIYVDRLENERLYDIFRNHNAIIPKTEMDELIDAVEGHTLTVDLMARSMVKGVRRTSAEKLLTALKKRDLTAGSFARVGSAYPGASRQARINEHLRTVFRVAELSGNEQFLLCLATLLPGNGIDPELFLAPFQDPDGIADILDDLIAKGWLTMKGDLLAIHPVICIVCREELEPTEENCGGFIGGVWGWYDRKHYDHARFRQIAELLTNASEILGDPDGWYLHHAGYLWGQVGENQQALNCQLRAAELLEESRPDSDHLATAYNNVGETYRMLGDLSGALEYHQKALALRVRILPPDHPDLAQSCNHVGVTYGDLGDHDRALEYNLKALTIREKVLPPNHPDLATSCNNVGSTYGDLGDHIKALEYKLKALAIFEKVLPPDHPRLAATYNNVGGTYGALGNHAKELEYQQKALAIREKVLPPTHPDLALSCNNLAWTYYKMGDYKNALKLIRRAADIAARSLPEGHPHRVHYRRQAERFELEARQRAEGE